MGKRYIVAILVVIFAYVAIILWYQEGSEIFQKFFSRQGQVVTFDQVESYQNQDDEEYSYPQQAEEPVFTTPKELFAPGNIVNSEDALSFAEDLENLAINEITKNTVLIKRQIRGGDIASLFQEGNPKYVNDLFASDTIDNNEKSSPFIDTVNRFFEWLSGTES